MASDEDETVYCICREPYDGERFMIECDVCKDWFHGSCVGIEEHQSADVEIYHCPNCQVEHGPLVLKKRRNWHRHDYAELDEGGVKAIQTGTVTFIQELKNRTFPNAEGVALKRMRGYELTMEYLLEHGFDLPVLVEKKDGLDLKIPPPTFTIQDVENYVGSMRELDVIDVSKQEDCKMLMREWVEYYNSPNRKGTYNVISLEFSGTKLADFVSPPRVIQDLSWVSNYWPHESPDEAPLFQRPEVQRYCLMGVKDSFTDFHIDFGGTSVWYHVLRGEKIFYLIHPTNANMILYENWVSSSNQSEMFFGDQVDACYKCTVKQGQTLFLPTGWIHAVLTPIDSLVFGGNFLHNLHIDTQIRVYEIEKRVQTPKKFLFPNYETLHWYAAKHILETLRECVEDGAAPPQHLLSGAKALAVALKSWTSKKDLNSRCIYVKQETVPDTVQYGRLLKDLQKEVKHLTQKYGEKEEKKKKKKKAAGATAKSGKRTEEEPDKKARGKVSVTKKEPSSPKGDAKISPPIAEKDEPVLPSMSPSVSSSPLLSLPAVATSSCDGPLKLSFKLWPNPQGKGEMKAEVKNESKPSPVTSPSLTMRIPKAGAYMEKDISVYDFEDDDNTDVKPLKLSHRSDSSSMGSPPTASPKGLMTSPRGVLSSPKCKMSKEPGLRSPDFTSPLSIASSVKEESFSDVGGELDSSFEMDRKVSPLKLGSLVHPSQGLKLKVSGGKIVGGSRSMSLPSPCRESSQATSSEEKAVSHSSSDDHLAGHVIDTVQMTIDEVAANYENGSEDNYENCSRTTVKPGSLKLKLSVNKQNLSGSASSGGETSHTTSVCQTSLTPSQSSFTASQSDSEETSTSQGTPKAAFGIARQPPPAAPGLNGSIADILVASGYDMEESDLSIDEDVGGSPSMRDAIQGMLSMSRMRGGGSTTVTPGPWHPGAPKPKNRPAIRLHRDGKRTTGRPEEGERMPTCFKDEEYVYPTLDNSDQEDGHVFKPRGRLKKDETWNPKAKLQPNCPKPERPPRQNAKREAVESGLAAAAAKLATQPTPKRQYIRKKPKSEKLSPPAASFLLESPQPSTSFGLADSPPASILNSGMKRQLSAPQVKSAKKPKKGQATAKQRLGKILKIHKMMH